jgi:hypothetical protein
MLTPDQKPMLPRSKDCTPVLDDPIPGHSSRRRTRSTDCIAQSSPSKCTLRHDHASLLKPYAPSGAFPYCPFTPSLHSLTSLSSTDEAIAFPRQQSPRNLTGARVDGYAVGRRRLPLPALSSASSRPSATSGANLLLRSLSSRAWTSPSPSELEGRHRRARPSAPPRPLFACRNRTQRRSREPAAALQLPSHPRPP